MNNIVPVIWGITAIILVTVFYVVAEFRKPSAVFKNKPKKLLSFQMKINRSEAIQLMAEFAKTWKYTIAELLPDNTRIILGESAGFFSYGFFYAVYFTMLENGELLLEIGIGSKAIQIGPVVWSHQRKFQERLQEFLMKNTASKA